MPKTPLIERMTKGGAAKAWIKEVETKNKRIERLLELKEEYLNVIDLLACEKELLTKNRECHREPEAGLIFLRACVEQGRAPDTGDLKLMLRDFISLEEENEVLRNTISLLKNEGDRLTDWVEGLEGGDR